MSVLTTPRYAPASLGCAGALRNRLLATSVEAGWTSCILDHVEGYRAADPHETHATPDLTVVAATRGAHDFAVYRSGRWRSAIYQTGAVGMNAANETIRLKWANRSLHDPFRTAHLYVPGGFLTEAAELVRRPGQRLSADISSILVLEGGVAATVIASLLVAMQHGEADPYAETGLRWLALDLVARFGSRGGGRRQVGDAVILSDARLARAIEFMTAHLAQPITVAQIAHEAGVSPFHFSRLFARRVGVPPHAYLMQARMAKARDLLATTDLPVASVAAACGYVRLGSFSTAYRRHFGRQPSAHRL